MNTKLHQILRLLGVAAWLTTANVVAADWPGDIGPKQQIVMSSIVEQDANRSQRFSPKCTIADRKR